MFTIVLFKMVKMEKCRFSTKGKKQFDWMPTELKAQQTNKKNK